MNYLLIYLSYIFHLSIYLVIPGNKGIGIEARQRKFLYYTPALVGAGGGSRLLPSAGENGDNEKCPFRGPASVVVSGADIIHSRAGFVGFLSHDAIHAGDGLGGGFPASGINSGTAISHSCAGFFCSLSRLYSRQRGGGRGCGRGCLGTPG